MSSIYRGMENAKEFGVFSYAQPGHYIVRIYTVTVNEGRQREIATCAQYDVLQATYRPQVDPQGQGRTWNPDPVGSRPSWYQDMQKDGAMGAVRSFMKACLGIGPGHPRAGEFEALSPNLMDHAVSESNPFGGLFVALECLMIKTKKKGDDFTVYKWTPVDPSLGPPAVDLERFAMLGRTPAPQTQRQAPPAQAWGQQPPAFGAPPQAPWGQAPAFPPAPGWGSPPPPAMGPWLTPGTQFTQDRRFYAPPGATAWIPMPAGVVA